MASWLGGAEVRGVSGTGARRLLSDEPVKTRRARVDRGCALVCRELRKPALSQETLMSRCAAATCLISLSPRRLALDVSR